MQLITIEQARAHCKTDADDDDIVILYASSAEAACASAANRNLYVDAAALDAAIIVALADMATAQTAYDAAILAADALTDANAKALACEVAERNLNVAKLNKEATLYGKVAGADIIQAVLLTLGDYYAHREETVMGAMGELPTGAAAIMWRNRKVATI